MATFVKNHEHNLLPPADLVAEIQKLHENLRDERDQHLRTLADFKNYRRRIERDGNKFAEDGKREIMLPLLDVIDDIEKALQWVGNGEQALMSSVQIVHQKLLALLETQEVRPFDSVGELFTPDLHEAVAVVKYEKVEPGTVVEALHRGYFWRNELLRAAQVLIAK